MYNTARQIEEMENIREISATLKRKKEARNYLKKQKILGIFSIVMCFISLLLTKADLIDGGAAITFILIMLPLGLIAKIQKNIQTYMGI